MRLAAAQPFDGGDLLARGFLGRGLARAHRDAVEMHGAGAAQAGAAAELGAGHLQLLADDPEQRRVVGSVDLTRLTVDGECDHVSSVAVAVELSRRAHLFGCVLFLLLLFRWPNRAPRFLRPSRSVILYLKNGG